MLAIAHANLLHKLSAKLLTEHRLQQILVASVCMLCTAMFNVDSTYLRVDSTSRCSAVPGEVTRCDAATVTQEECTSKAFSSVAIK
jgi:hypothetical protein